MQMNKINYCKQLYKDFLDKKQDIFYLIVNGLTKQLVHIMSFKKSFYCFNLLFIVFLAKSLQKEYIKLFKV